MRKLQSNSNSSVRAQNVLFKKNFLFLNHIYLIVYTPYLPPTIPHAPKGILAWDQN